MPSTITVRCSLSVSMKSVGSASAVATMINCSHGNCIMVENASFAQNEFRISVSFHGQGFFQITDTNDNPPAFLESAYSFDILENAQRGSKVGQVKAVDADLGVNAQLTYSVISDWANDVFSLNPQTGVFTLTSHLDYEEVSENLSYIIHILDMYVHTAKSFCVVKKVIKYLYCFKLILK